MDEGLKTTSLLTPRFYIQRNLYKHGNPERPVFSSINCDTANISNYVDHHLQPIVSQTPRYKWLFTKTQHNKKIPDNSHLVSLDA